MNDSTILTQAANDFRVVLQAKERVAPRLKNKRGRVTQKRCVEEVLDQLGLDLPVEDISDLASQSYGRRITLGCALQHKYAILKELNIFEAINGLVQAKDAKGRVRASDLKPTDLVEVGRTWACDLPVGRLVALKEVVEVQGLIRLTFKNPDAWGECQVYLSPNVRVLAF